MTFFLLWDLIFDFGFVATGHDLAIKLLKMQQLDDEDDELAYRYRIKNTLNKKKIIYFFPFHVI